MTTHRTDPGRTTLWNHVYTHHTSAVRARLWPLLIDVDGRGRWNGGIESIVLDGPLAVGTSFQGTSIRVDHRLEDAADGTTTIVYQITVTGDVHDDIAEQIGSAVSAGFPDVMRHPAEVAS